MTETVDRKVLPTLNRPNPLPREVAPGVFWLGECLEQPRQGKVYHGCNACFLIIGETASIMVESGHPKDFPIIEGQLAKLLAGKPPLKYLFVTHQETPHCGGFGRIMSRYPDVILCGDVSEFHLAFPQYEHRMRFLKEGDEIDLGGRSFRIVEPVIRDMRSTWWGLETRDRVLFPGDGFAYSHYHEDSHCGMVAEEAVSIDLEDATALFADLALWWTKWADMRNYVDRLQIFMDAHEVKTVCPTHGLVITDVARTMPRVMEGLLYGSNGSDGNSSAGKALIVHEV